MVIVPMSPAIAGFSASGFSLSCLLESGYFLPDLGGSPHAWILSIHHAGFGSKDILIFAPY
jgi:hypothetical protein